MADPFVTDRGARVLRNPWVMGLAAMPYLLAVGAILSAAVTHLPQFLFGVPHLRALRSIGALANVDARTAPVLPDKLWRIVEDPAAPADARAGAAVALGRSVDEEGRSRLRAAASATAAPKLRIAIEKAAGDADDEALTAALAEVEADADRSEKRA